MATVPAEASAGEWMRNDVARLEIVYTSRTAGSVLSRFEVTIPEKDAVVAWPFISRLPSSAEVRFPSSRTGTLTRVPGAGSALAVWTTLTPPEPGATE